MQGVRPRGIFPPSGRSSLLGAPDAASGPDTVIEGLANTLLEPLAARWRDTALGSSAAVWLAIVLLYIIAHPGAAVCAGSSAPWCRVAGARPVGPALLLLAAAGLVAATAFLAASAAPALFALLTSDSWIRGRRPVTWAGLLLVKWQYAKRKRIVKRFGEPAIVSASPPDLRFAERRTASFDGYI